MSRLCITMAEDRRAFLPGEQIAGQVSWELDDAPRIVELKLVWETRGPGGGESATAQSVAFDKPLLRDCREFQFALPDGPYSFTGQIISLVWRLELSIDPGGHSEFLEIIFSPRGQPIVLEAVSGGK